MNFQMFKLDLEKAELEIKLPRSVGSLKMQEFQKNIYFCLTDYTKAFHWITTNWKILRDGNIRPHDLPPEKYVYRSRSNSWHGTTHWFQIGKGVCLSCMLSPCLFNLYAEYIIQNARLDEDCWEKYQWPQICKKWQKARTKVPLDERGEWKSWLKTQHSKNWDHGIWSHHFKANRWRKVETTTDFIFLGSKIFADGDCSHKIKRYLFPWKKSCGKPRQSFKKQRHHFADKVRLVRAMVFPVVMYRC